MLNNSYIFDNKLENPIVETPKILLDILSIEPSDSELAFGNLGPKLLSFFKNLEITHPDTCGIVNSIFVNDKDFISQTLELLDLIKNCKNLSKISNRFKKLINQSRISKNFLSERFGIRAFSDRDYVNNIRKLRKLNSIKLNYIESDIRNFSKFVRYSNSYSDDLRINERKAERYIDLGCELTVSKVNLKVKKYKDLTSDNVLGFARIALTDAGSISSRFNNFVISNNKITNFDYLKVKDFEYAVRLYPLHMLDIPKDMSNIKTHLDNFPEIGGKALFDDFVVLLPTVRLIGDYIVNNKNFDCEEDALKYIDLYLMNNGIIPVLLGERDNKFYFIAYWR